MRDFFASSACVYNHDKQTDPSVTGLKEADAYPAMPEDGYGWENFSLKECAGILMRILVLLVGWLVIIMFMVLMELLTVVEKKLLQCCRKVIQAKMSGENEIEIWGDGNQTRSFMYIDDCVKGTQAIMNSEDVCFPINLGSEEKVSINELVDVVEKIAE